MSESRHCCPEDLREAVSIHTRKITDSCTDKDCIEDLRVYMCRDSQELLDNAAGIRARSAELIYADVDVEAIPFHRNHYCIDITFYYRILADTAGACARPHTLCGLAVFSKRAVLCGEDSRAKVFTSEENCQCGSTSYLRNYNSPTAVVEVLDPMVLASRVRDVCECPCGESGLNQVPERVRTLFEDELVFSGDRRRLYVTLGQFSIIRLERDVQIVVPTLECVLPTKECCDDPGCAEDPCEMFSRIEFPVKQFFPCGCEMPEGNFHTSCRCKDSCE